jgi:GTP cyclohydrolase I
MSLQKIEKAYLTIIEQAGENPSREGLVNTPKRAAKALMALTEGYRQNLDEIINGALFSSDTQSIVVVKDIELYSLCEHHLLPFIGKCHIGYIPNGKVLGLSKLARIVDYFAKRFQIQENLTHEIAECILQITGAVGVGVVIEAKHLCMMMRGVEKQNSVMKTSTLLGVFLEDSNTRKEFFELIR